MLDLDLDVWRLTLHLLAAAIWVGGQLVLVALVPVLRGLGGDATRLAARRYNEVAWPAFAVLVVTGMWNLAEIDVGDRSTEYHVTLGVKLLLVAASGIAAALHSATASKVILAVGGAVALIGGLAAFVLGVAMSSGY